MLGLILNGVQIPAFNGNGFGPILPVFGLSVLYPAIMFAVAYRILTRIDLDPQSKILWLLVVAFIPLGFVLYWIIAPPVPAAIGSPRRIVPGSDVSGTPWAGKSDYTKQPR